MEENRSRDKAQCENAHNKIQVRLHERSRSRRVLLARRVHILWPKADQIHLQGNVSQAQEQGSLAQKVAIVEEEQKVAIVDEQKVAIVEEEQKVQDLMLAYVEW